MAVCLHTRPARSMSTHSYAHKYTNTTKGPLILVSCNQLKFKHTKKERKKKQFTTILTWAQSILVIRHECQFSCECIFYIVKLIFISISCFFVVCHSCCGRSVLPVAAAAAAIHYCVLCVCHLCRLPCQHFFYPLAPVDWH